MTKPREKILIVSASPKNNWKNFSSFFFILDPTNIIICISKNRLIWRCRYIVKLPLFDAYKIYFHLYKLNIDIESWSSPNLRINFCTNIKISSNYMKDALLSEVTLEHLKIYTQIYIYYIFATAKEKILYYTRTRCRRIVQFNIFM